MDYLRMLFHIDLIKYNSLLSFFKANRKILNRIYMNIGFLDSMIAASSFRNMLDYYSEPELMKSSRPNLTVMDLYHPLLDNPVPNSISEERSVLITGSNASGKSTFVKTLAINAVLSETIFKSLSKSYKASYFMIYSSMALRDNIFSNESYYIVEIKSLKRIIDSLNEDIPALCFIDEVLRGTNTLERIAASSHILSSLAKSNTLVFAATHDIELTHILDKYYSNYHFQERISENEILFDYKLYEGRAVSKNAIKLLGMLGYSKDIIQNAEKAAEEFLKNGEWSNIK
jgi:DNA mismatch repair ATPase MutS